MKQQGTYIIHFGGTRDVGVRTGPKSALVINGVLASFGDPADFDPDLNEFIEKAEVIDQRDHVVLPAMVNAHTHLELTDIGLQPYDPAGGFVGWVKQLRALQPSSGEELIQSARRGAQMCLEAGVHAVGDITSSVAVAQARRSQGLTGVSYLELFGLGSPFNLAALGQFKAERTGQHDRDRRWVGFQPHAPYSAGHDIYAEASHYAPSSTHLAETREEAEFVGSLSGPLFDYVNEFGRWDESFTKRYGKGLSPVQWMRMYLEAKGGAYNQNRWLVAHCNYVDDDDIKLLADTKTSVAYCPIASEYFGHEDHRYRDMLAAGINVCLGTDSIVCADPNDPQPLGVMGAMRRLYRRDGTAPETLLKMATVNGTQALVGSGMLDDVKTHCLVSAKVDMESPVDPLVQILTDDALVETMVFESLPESDERVFDGSPKQHWLHRLRHHGLADGSEPA